MPRSVQYSARGRWGERPLRPRSDRGPWRYGIPLGAVEVDEGVLEDSRRILEDALIALIGLHSLMHVLYRI